MRLSLINNSDSITHFTNYCITALITHYEPDNLITKYGLKASIMLNFVLYQINGCEDILKTQEKFPNFLLKQINTHAGNMIYWRLPDGSFLWKTFLFIKQSNNYLT